MKLSIKIPDINFSKINLDVIAWIGAIITVFILIKKLISIKSYKLDLPEPTYTPKLTYPRETYRNWADSLYAAMNRWGTDEDTIYSILNQLKTKEDWNYLKRVFGNQQCTRHCLGFKGGNLPQWLYEELDSYEINKVRKILSKIGVTI